MANTILFCSSEDKNKIYDIRFDDETNEMIVCDKFAFNRNEVRQLFQYIKTIGWNKKKGGK